MDSVELSENIRRSAPHASGALVRRERPAAPATRAAPVDRRAGGALLPDESRKLTVGAQPWLVRGGFDVLLQRVAPKSWSMPAGQGWQMVKKNGAREVWRAEIDGRAYFLKYYQRDSWRGALKALLSGDAARAEWNGGLFALRNGIEAARPVACTSRIQREGKSWALLVSEAVEPAQALDEYWLSVQSDENALRRREDTAQLIEILAESIARAHQAGFEHLDMHAANILIQTLAPRRYRAVLIDLHSARLDTPLSDAAVVRNLAQLNQWFSKHASATDRLRFLRAYMRWRNEFEHAFAHARTLESSFDQVVRALVQAARRHADRLWAQRDRRIGRNGRYFARLRLGGGWAGVACITSKRAVSESRASGLTLTKQWWADQLKSPERLLTDGGGAARLKDSHSAQVLRCTLAHPDAPLEVIVKRPLARNLWRRLRSLLGPSRARRGFEMGHALLHRDLATARPLAALERRIGPFVLDSILLTETVAGAVDLPTHLRRAAAPRLTRAWYRQKRELSAHLVRHLRRLHERGFVHRDCKAENILVREAPLALLWIDMDGLRRAGRSISNSPRGMPASAELRALARLHVSLLEIPGLTRTDRVRFLKAYRAGYGVAEDAWRADWRILEGLVAGKLVAREQRKAWKRAHYGRE